MNQTENEKSNGFTMHLPCKYGETLYHVYPATIIDYPDGLYKNYGIKQIYCAGFELKPLQSFMLDEKNNRFNIKQFGNVIFYSMEQAMERKAQLNKEQFSKLKTGTTVWELDTYSDETNPHIVECVIKSIILEGDSILFEIEGKDDITHDNVISSDVFADWLFLTEYNADAALERYIASRPRNGWMLEKE